MTDKILSDQAEEIIRLAWADTVPFETLRLEFGLTESEVKKFMRVNQSPKTYRRWRERVTKRSGPKSKHWHHTSITSTKQKL